MARLGAWAALALLTVYVVFIGGGWQGIYTPALRVFTLSLALIALTGWAIVAWRRPDWRPTSSLLPAIVLCIMSLGISTALSRHPRFGIDYLAYAIVLGALYLFLVQILRHRFFRSRMVTLAVGMFVSISGLFLILVSIDWVELWNLVGRVTVPPLRPKSESLTYGNPSAVMTMSFLLACSSAAAVGAFSGKRRALLLAGTLLAGAVLLISGSRSGWFAVGLAVPTTGVLALGVGQNWIRFARLLRSIRESRGAFIATSLIVGLGLVLAVAVAPTVIDRLSDSGSSLRIGYAIAAMRMFVESPLVGIGPGMWVSERISETRPPELDYYIPHAHDIYVQTLAELGVIGAAVGLFLGIQLFRLIRSAVTDGDYYRRRWGWAACLAIVYFALHQVLDFYANFPSVLFAAALPIAWLDATSEPGAGLLRRPGPAALSVGAVSVALSFGLLFVSEGPALQSFDAVAKANEGEWADALTPAKEAVEADPEWPPYQLTYGLSLSRAGDHSEAAAAFRRAAETDGLPEAWLNLAAERAELGDSAGALEASQRAMRLGYQRPGVSAAAGDLALRLGAIDVAVDALARAITVSPSFAGDPWFHETPERDAIYHAVVELAIERSAPGSQWEVALMAGENARALELTSQADASSRPLIEDVIAALGGDEAAYQEVIRLCSKEPLNGQALNWCARLTAARGDNDAANEYRAWGFVIGLAYQSMSELRVSKEELTGRSVEGDLAQFYGLYTYRRSTPWDILVPTLLHFTVK